MNLPRLLLGGLTAALAFAVPLVRAADWFDFDPGPDPLPAGSVLDLRHLNEAYAGEHGRIEARDGRFVHGATGEAVRFWAVNGPHYEGTRDDPAALRRIARVLAQRGVNLVRLHGAVFDRRNGRLDERKVRWIRDVVAALKAEGIYSLISIYFPLWFTPEPGLEFLPGYDGQTHPFAALYFDDPFQRVYLGWWRAILDTPDAAGVPLRDDAAVMGLELVNEDSLFFWTFSDQRIPEEPLRRFESAFARWAARKHGSADAALAAWGGERLKRDAPSEGRLAFRPLFAMANERTARDRDTARFCYEVQRDFYAGMKDALRNFGYPGLVTASNWTTADQQVLGPIERLSYLTGDFVDRHGYFSNPHEGENAAWSIRNGHRYRDRSALRFEAGRRGDGRRDFSHPAMDVHYADRPSMISETTWTRPNRYRVEAPLFYAVYGALQDSDAIVHFALDSTGWQVKPNFWMQPWTLMSPTQMGQFPAAALIYRQGLVAEGPLVADIGLTEQAVLALQGTPLPQEASLDELRAADLPTDGRVPEPGQRLDPLIHFVGRTRVSFDGRPSTVADLRPHLDRSRQVVRSATGEIALDWKRGLLTWQAPGAQGAVGDLAAAGKLELAALALEVPLDNVAVALVALDGRPVAESSRLLLQVMAEEQATGFATKPDREGWKLIQDIGRDPWQVRRLGGTIALRRPDAAALTVTALDLQGRPRRAVGQADRFALEPRTVSYLIAPAP